MVSDTSEMTARLSAIRDADDVYTLRANVMRALALHRIGQIYFVAPLTPDPRVGRILTNLGISRVWERHYRARLSRIDPLPGLSLEYPNAFYWPDDVDREALDAKQLRYLGICERFGFGSLVGTACYGPRGRAGFLGALWPKRQRPADDVLLAVHQIGQVSFQRYCQLVREAMDIPPPSNRELEVLSYMCEGKSNPEMAQIIGVSRSSIDAYIRRIFAKLDVNDRTAACVRAYSLGFLASEEVRKMGERALATDSDALPLS